MKGGDCLWVGSGTSRVRVYSDNCAAEVCLHEAGFGVRAGKVMA
ncbi:MAG: hypothetical protein RBU23_04075 [Candidatus Auribacterota bacterium]|nr:hypothetical protein [Candidatus Auribacterota bacterium]